MSLKTEFETAVANAQKLSERPDNMTLLKLYALYKQGSEGDNLAARPKRTADPVGFAKWDTWDALRGTSVDDAMQQYIDLVQWLQTE